MTTEYNAEREAPLGPNIPAWLMEEVTAALQAHSDGVTETEDALAHSHEALESLWSFVNSGWAAQHNDGT